jgi:hypothetical protein
VSAKQRVGGPDGDCADDDGDEGPLDDEQKRDRHARRDREIARRAVVGDEPPGADPLAVDVVVDRPLGVALPWPKFQSAPVGVHPAVGGRRRQSDREPDGRGRREREREQRGRNDRDRVQRREVQRSPVARIQIQIRKHAPEKSGEKRRRGELGDRKRDRERKRHPDQRVRRQHH